ncbi:unnamed protein product [Chondrus crispus]|uniref:Uncharacterized protein n=1 Tax=Chondrus crispus TaxID=2769 RepID=R7QEK6_CHOCR|nr:unnamed protein product [Chondrus crispus]CDF35865.1 unnamed protein product [Chondrus crispus]|eukprot:XP_005715684.1 unnamed protein product [Chondrus crispus]
MCKNTVHFSSVNPDLPGTHVYTPLPPPSAPLLPSALLVYAQPLPSPRPPVRPPPIHPTSLRHFPVNMVRFLRYWIEQNMESPESIERAAQKHIEKMSEGSVKLRDRWDKPPKPAGYWNAPAVTRSTTLNNARAEAELLSPYARLLREMDDARSLADRK